MIFQVQIMDPPYEILDAEPVDFENNGLIWLPTEPENEEDEKEPTLFDDDVSGDGNAVGESHNSMATKKVVEGHLRALVAQLLQADNLPIGEDYEKDNWLEIVPSILLEVASSLQPSTSGTMDPFRYVKVKCIASGKRSESVVIRGVVCEKNVAHRRMATKRDKARILIIGGVLDYQKTPFDDLSSFDDCSQRHQMAVEEIAAQNPNVLLVENSVSQFVKEYLLEKDVSLVQDVPRPVLEQIARSTGASIAPSIDDLLSQKLGYCGTFRVERFEEEFGDAVQSEKTSSNTLMFFEGCQKPFGYTILLRGAPADELKRVKRVVQHAVFAAYHLPLEISFLADEGASLPVDNSITVALSGNHSTGSDFLQELVPVKELPVSSCDQLSILVSFSSRCVWKGIACEDHYLKIKYYGTFDVPLGRFLRDHLFDKHYSCRSCSLPSEAHVHCYTHRQGTLTVSVKELSEFSLPGEGEGRIWMWHRCLRCPSIHGLPPVTRRRVLSDAAWNFSFGKYLEFSFSNHTAANIVGGCGHSLHRDCLRFFGFGNRVACFRYASIDVFSVHLPQPKLIFHRENELELPVGANDSVIPVYDDEPSSIISYALTIPQYQHQTVTDEGERLADGIEVLHSRISFVHDGLRGKAKYSVTCYCAKQFEALRRICCPSENDFIRSLSRCEKVGPRGQKSPVSLIKTLDGRFVVKQVTEIELESFIKFAPAYFEYINESGATCLEKILGIYQVTSKHLKGWNESKNVVIVENILFQRSASRLYDLKGSRSRYNPDPSGSNKVLLDLNLIEAMQTSPIFLNRKATQLLARAVYNDTAFLASVDVMNYSLLAAVDEEKKELVVGMIDYMRQYTWDKHIETWVKTSGILCCSKEISPTVIPPKQYKQRFRKAMASYFVMVPDQGTSPSTTPSTSLSDSEENIEPGTLIQ